MGPGRDEPPLKKGMCIRGLPIRLLQSGRFFPPLFFFAPGGEKWGLLMLGSLKEKSKKTEPNLDFISLTKNTLRATAKYWLYFLRGYPTRANPEQLPRTIEK